MSGSSSPRLGKQSQQLLPPQRINQRGDDIPTQDTIEMDNLPRPSGSSAPSILKIIKSFSSKTPRTPADTTQSKNASLEELTTQPDYGWIRGVVLCALGASTIAVINIIFATAALILAYTKYKNHGAGSLSIYEGECGRSKGWATGLHLVINILSTLLLGASNYCMQCLSAPSRADVDEAHARRTWLEIGTSGLRNLWFVKKRRRILWIILLLSSLPIHLLYNSVVFSIITTYEYPVMTASSDSDFNFDSLRVPEKDSCFGELTGHTIPNMIRDISNSDIFEVLTKQQCAIFYSTDYVTDRRSLIVLTDKLRNSSVDLLWNEKNNGDGGIMYNDGSSRYGWMCRMDDQNPDLDHPFICNRDRVLNNLENWEVIGGVWKEAGWTMYMPADSGEVVPFYSQNWETTLNESAIDELLDPLDWLSDRQTLVDYLDTEPFQRELDAFLHNSTHWQNSSWAASLTYRDDGVCGNAGGEKYPVNGCLSERIEEKCRLMFNLPICLVVLSCNIVKVVCMFLTAKENRRDVFLTIGDAVASFLNRPDPTTLSRCTMSKATVGKTPYQWGIGGLTSRFFSSLIQKYNRSPLVNGGESDSRHLTAAEEIVPAILPGQKRWFQAAGSVRWGVVIAAASGGIGVAAFFLNMAIGYLDKQNISHTMNGLWKLGFGTVNAITLIGDEAKLLPSHLAMLVLANTPQLYLSIAYFAFNNLLTTMVLSAEYGKYALQRKPLRVSWPKGEQSQTYYLTLPYLYSVPLLSTSAILHWLLSQSIFYVGIDVEYIVEPTDKVNTNDWDISTCGFSPLALIFVILVAGLMTLSILLLGLRPYKSPAPLAGNCSAAISAACHRPPDDRAAALKPIMWGELSDSGSQGQSGSVSPERKSEDTDNKRMYSLVPDNEQVQDSLGRRSLGSRLSSVDTKYGGSGVSMQTNHPHCCFTSKEVVTPSPTTLYL